ncbi:hypothetical protein ABZS61_08735 [Streptomyces sp. NPDC005566]|uniref:hypothetical protein n=1 Tax=Streptomyces sp. NPDC005566 TaxID=3156886 RepID=UPI0033AFC749
MRIRTTAAVAAILAVTVVGCSSDNGDGDNKTGTVKKTAPEASSAADSSGTAKDVDLPPEPTGAERSAVLEVIHDVNGNLVHDEDKAIAAARNQCAALTGGATDPDHSAAQRFSYGGITLTDDDGSHLNFGLRKTLCPES